jgi:hypothetical protein
MVIIKDKKTITQKITTALGKNRLNLGMLTEPKPREK